MKALSVRFEEEKDAHFHHFCSKTVLKVLATGIKQEEEIKASEYERKK